MLDDVNASWPKALVDRLETLEQGHVVTGSLLLGFYGDRLNAASQFTARLSEQDTGIQWVEPSEQPSHWIITTQSCDLSEEGTPQRAYFLAAPVYRRDDLGERSRFEIEQLGVRYLVPLSGEEFREGYYVADLRIQVPFDKGLLVGAVTHDGFAGEDDRRRFASRLAGLYDRPAFPREISDNVVETLRKYFKKSQQRREQFTECDVREIRLGMRGEPISEVWLLVIVTAAGNADGVRNLLDQWFVSTVAKLAQLNINLSVSCNRLTLLSALEYVSTDPIALSFLTSRTRSFEAANPDVND
jgi:hypothetical protein